MNVSQIDEINLLYLKQAYSKSASTAYMHKVVHCYEHNVALSSPMKGGIMKSEGRPAGLQMNPGGAVLETQHSEARQQRTDAATSAYILPQVSPWRCAGS